LSLRSGVNTSLQTLTLNTAPAITLPFRQS
jgi:hypothetical protein